MLLRVYKRLYFNTQKFPWLRHCLRPFFIRRCGNSRDFFAFFLHTCTRLLFTKLTYLFNLPWYFYVRKRNKTKKWLQPSRNTFRGIKAIYGWGISNVKGIVKFGKVPLVRNKILEHVIKVKPRLAREGCRCGNRMVGWTVKIATSVNNMLETSGVFERKMLLEATVDYNHGFCTCN